MSPDNTAPISSIQHVSIPTATYFYNSPEFPIKINRLVERAHDQDQVERFLYIRPDYLYSPVCYTRTKLRYRDEGGLYLPRLHDLREQGRPVKGFIHHHMKDIGGAILGNSILPPTLLHRSSEDRKILLAEP